MGIKKLVTHSKLLRRNNKIMALYGFGECNSISKVVFGDKRANGGELKEMAHSVKGCVC